MEQHPVFHNKCLDFVTAQLMPSALSPEPGPENTRSNNPLLYSHEAYSSPKAAKCFFFPPSCINFYVETKDKLKQYVLRSE